MSWATALIANIKSIFANGAVLPQRYNLNFSGSGVTVTDDPVNLRTNVAITGGAAPAQVTISASGPVTAQNGYEYFVNLFAAGGNVSFVTTALTAAQSFSIYVIDPAGSGTGGHSCTIAPIVAGAHIDALFPPSGPSAPGTLTTSAVLTAVGESISLTTPDGTNLWGVPS
jgi:hypothetical protein